MDSRRQRRSETLSESVTNGPRVRQSWCTLMVDLYCFEQAGKEGDIICPLLLSGIERSERTLNAGGIAAIELVLSEGG